MAKRNIAKCVILTLVTFGIYGICWIVKLMQDAVHTLDTEDNGTAEILLGLFLSPVGFFLAEKKFAEACKSNSVAHEDRSIVYLILGFVGFGWVSTILMQSELNSYIAQLYPESVIDNDDDDDIVDDDDDDIE